MSDHAPTASDEPPSRLLPDELLQPGERVLLELKPAPAMILIESYRVIFWAALLAVANELLRPDRWLFDEARLVVAAIAVGAVLLRVGVAVLEWFSRAYVLTDRRVLRQRGILQIDLFESRLDRIQNTVLVFPLAQRVLGVGTILLTTAGTALPEAAWYCIPDPLDVHHRLVAALAQARNGDGDPGGPSRPEGRG